MKTKYILSDTETMDDKTQCKSEKSSLSNEKKKVKYIYIATHFLYSIHPRTIFFTYINCLIICKKDFFSHKIKNLNKNIIYQVCQLQAKKMNMMKITKIMNLFCMVEE